MIEKNLGFQDFQNIFYASFRVERNRKTENQSKILYFPCPRFYTTFYKRARQEKLTQQFPESRPKKNGLIVFDDSLVVEITK